MIFPPFSNSTTSREAAEAISPVAKSLRDSVLFAIRTAMTTGDHGATAQDIEKWLEIPGNTVRPRIRELVQSGMVYDSGETRRLASGRKAIIWRAR